MEKIPKEFWEDAKWAEKHYSELVKKFPDEWVAVVNREVVTAGKDLAKVKEEAMKNLSFCGALPHDPASPVRA